MINKGSMIKGDHIVARNCIIIQPKIFKQTLMMLHTERAKQIRNYYLTLEQILIDYLKYTNQVNATNLTVKEKHSVYRFLNQYTGSGQIKASIFYEQYVTFCSKSNDILTNRVFGKELNKRGIITKRTYKDGKCYSISSESIQLWKSNFTI